MSYDLAIWEGPRPAADAAAAAEFGRLMEEHVEAAPGGRPTPAITRYVQALLARWPDLTDDGRDDSPWSSGPMIGDASGPILYVALRWSMAEEACAFCAATARAHGLVCFDPQSGQLR